MFGVVARRARECYGVLTSISVAVGSGHAHIYCGEILSPKHRCEFYRVGLQRFKFFRTFSRNPHVGFSITRGSSKVRGLSLTRVKGESTIQKYQKTFLFNISNIWDIRENSLPKVLYFFHIFLHR